MSVERNAVRSVDWPEVFPAFHLFSALRLGLSFRAMLLALAALILVSAGWQVAGKVFSGSEEPHLAAAIQATSAWPWERPLVATTAVRGATEDWPGPSPLVLAWREISEPFRRLYAAEMSFTEFVYLLSCALWSLLVWSFFGGAITRLAAVSFARQENVSLGELGRFVRPRLPAYFAGPLFPLLGTGLGACLLAVLGLVMRSGVGVFLAGLVWPLVLVAGFVMAFLLIGLFFGWPLMWGAVSAEGTDSFGALSHSYSYVYQRPLHYLVYAAVAGLIGVLGWFLVSLFAIWIVELSKWGVSFGSGSLRVQEVLGAEHDLGALGNFGASLIWFWNSLLLSVASAFVFSYFWSATTVIYFLLRRSVDATQLDEIYLSEEENLHGLPPLKTGPDGVAQIADDEIAADPTGSGSNQVHA